MSPSKKRGRSLSSPGSSLTSWDKVDKSRDVFADAKATFKQELAAKEKEIEEERTQKEAAVNAKKELETDYKQMQAELAAKEKETEEERTQKEAAVNAKKKLETKALQLQANRPDVLGRCLVGCMRRHVQHI